MNRPPDSTQSLPSNLINSALTLSRDLGITVVIVTHELPSIFLVADDCIVLDKAAKGIVARGDPRKLRDESKIPFVHNFFTRSSAGASNRGG
jgi:phospholipid/cholesterol/gamma-HCH transport system ATP-binding protein